MDRIIAPKDWVPVTLGGGSVNLNTLGGASRNAMALLPTGSGEVTVTMAGSAGVSRVLPAVSGQPIIGEFLTYESSSGPTALHAAYP